ncbi:MAG: class I SAM-dependent methyltransferase [Solirubrobacterales bacterium]
MARALRSSVVGAAVDAYDRHVGRYGPELAREMVRVTGVRAGQRALDVGCGTGALTATLAKVLGAGNVAAIDPSEGFVAACRARLPAAEVRVGIAEELPWGDAEFDAVLAQLVVDGMNDARRGAEEMRRVARPGGALSACIWDFDGGMTLLQAAWDSALDVDAELARSFGADKRNPFSRPDELEELWRTSGFEGVELGHVEAGADYADFDDLWYPFANGVGNLGRFHEALDEGGRERFKRGAAERLGSPSGPFRLTATAWYVRGTAPAG